MLTINLENPPMLENIILNMAKYYNIDISNFNFTNLENTFFIMYEILNYKNKQKNNMTLKFSQELQYYLYDDLRSLIYNFCGFFIHRNAIMLYLNPHELSYDYYINDIICEESIMYLKIIFIGINFVIACNNNKLYLFVLNESNGKYYLNMDKISNIKNDIDITKKFNYLIPINNVDKIKLLKY
jgi:hypothetical protein